MARIGGPVVSERQLNRTLLERQLLLRRDRRPALAAVEHLVGLQAQDPLPPYLALWSRLDGFEPDELGAALEERTAVRTWVMRFTIQLVTAADCLAIRPVVQPALVAGVLSTYRRELDGVDLDELAALARDLLGAEPLTSREVGQRLAQLRWPEHDPRALGNAARALVPAVQVTPRGVWGRSGGARHATVEDWLGRPVADDPSPGRLVLRYLAAFGPATAADVRTWSGLTGIAGILERLRPQLRTVRDEGGRELLDLPDAPWPDPDTPAPPRLLPRFDNALLSHADRTRIIDPDHRQLLASRTGMPPPAFLVDGRVAGTWRITDEGGDTHLRLRPFAPLDPAAIDALCDEAAGMLRFVTGGDADDVRLEEPGAGFA